MGCRRSKVVKPPRSPRSKAAVVRASPSVVSVTTHDVPGVFRGYGVIIESEVGGDATYFSTIIAPAVLFTRSNGLHPHQIKFDVCVSDDKLYKGELLACDFHYNLAAIRIQSESPLQPALLRALDDVSSVDIEAYQHSQSHAQNPFQLRRHSDLFKVQSGTKIIILCCSHSPPFSVEAACGVFRASHHSHHDCNELCWVNHAGIKEKQSGAVINLFGEVIGIMFYRCAFLPSNFISRWWNHQKSSGKFCRPWVGVEIANLAAARLTFLEQFRKIFSDVGKGVIVTKVEKNTPAYCSGIRLKDVIVKCDGKPVQSKMEFFESMWDNAGKSVELTVLRASHGRQLDLSMSIGETDPAKFFQWMLPFVSNVPVASSDTSSEELSDTTSSDELPDSGP